MPNFPVTLSSGLLLWHTSNGALGSRLGTLKLALKWWSTHPCRDGVGERLLPISHSHSSPAPQPGEDGQGCRADTSWSGDRRGGDFRRPEGVAVQVMDRGVGWCEGQSCSTRSDCDPSGGVSPQTSVCPARGASWLQPRRHISALNSMNTIHRRQTGECRSADAAVPRRATQRDCTTVRSKINSPAPPIGWPPSLDWWTLSGLGSPE
jgi:hypothetical protein